MIWAHLLGVVGAAFCATPATSIALVPTGLPEPPEYYEIALVSTGRIPGTRQAEGTGGVTFSPSPFGLALGPDGSYRYDVHIQTERLLAPEYGVYVAWVTTPELDQVRRLSPLDGAGEARGSVEWNQFLVVVTLEPTLNPEAQGWEGPVVMRGVSRSGMMHTMAGHGPFEVDNCASFGFN